ncbi:HEPN domain-containing protein [Leptolyngbya sp. BC1307]|uniref:HEPN domain-containing protein n=1 Tax=Leptolyngbya sp. BC1307 TaxID=2029589 RepID=UPI000EFA77E0|nr:HEPN domain-containing protein [Leptolyngbya sp. BC1307]
MPAPLLKTQTIIDDCESFLESSGGYGSPIESYLVQYALVILCADVQQEIYAIVKRRADTISDRQISAFVSTVCNRVLRSVSKKEIASFVGFFGEEEKNKFNDLLDDAEVTRYNNAVSNRHDVAHRGGVQITFRELKEAKVSAIKILSAMATVIEGSNPIF